ncbi:hypothetical protein [Mycolicibacterium phlei]|uniref:hypothetical protein n=2 Tax=Mycolicibacterium phlei TaxID=1771 RepID=UPI00025AD558|nr:hypothetical protein [Mycolicibacterium phlei]EID09726.1 hypothetical protein MPHLEI_23974 [Mycolicibacterium phlei RIVM601174]MBF4190602.1 hypothetical protein [Mycolicibacterium phlei]
MKTHAPTYAAATAVEAAGMFAIPATTVDFDPVAGGTTTAPAHRPHALSSREPALVEAVSHEPVSLTVCAAFPERGPDVGVSFVSRSRTPTASLPTLTLFTLSNNVITSVVGDGKPLSPNPTGAGLGGEGGFGAGQSGPEGDDGADG